MKNTRDVMLMRIKLKSLRRMKSLLEERDTPLPARAYRMMRELERKLKR